jgi:hypothetical protein
LAKALLRSASRAFSEFTLLARNDPSSAGLLSRKIALAACIPRLAPFAQPSRQLQAAMLEMGKPGGILDAKDALDRGPVDLIVDLALSENNLNNTAHTAGTTFMGQFMDHDMTFDLLISP